MSYKSALEWGYRKVGTQERWYEFEVEQVQNWLGVERICGRNQQELVGIILGAKHSAAKGFLEKWEEQAAGQEPTQELSSYSKNSHPQGAAKQ